MNDNLSEDEVEAMLEKGSTGGGGQDPQAEPYDFTTPAPIPSEQKTTVSLIHEGYAQGCALTLSSFLRTDVEIKLQRVEQMTFAQYAKSMVNPTCVATYDMLPLNGYGLMEVSPPLLYVVVNRMLGGPLEAPSKGRDFTELEFSIVRRFMKILLQELESAWAFILNISFNLKETQSNPAFVRIIPMRELCLVVTLKAKAGETAGLITVILPYSNLEPVTSKLGNKQWSKYSVRQSEDILAAHQRNFNSIELAVNANLGQVELSMTDLLALNVGDILSLDQKASAPITVNVAGTPKFLVNPGLVGRYKGFRIQEEIG